MKVTIFIPCYNSEHKILKLAESILLQTHRDFDVVFLNNGSNDSTMQVIDEFALHDNRFRSVNRFKNIGPFLNIYNAITHLQDGFFSLVADDMIMEPTYLECCLDVMRSDPSIALCYSGVYLHNGSQTIPYFDPYELNSENAELRCITLAKKLNLGTAVYGFYNASILQDMRRFWSSFQSIRLSDLQLLVHVALRGKIHQIGQNLIHRNIGVTYTDYYERIISCYVTKNPRKTMPFAAAIYTIGNDILEYTGDRDFCMNFSIELILRFNHQINHELNQCNYCTDRCQLIESILYINFIIDATNDMHIEIKKKARSVYKTIAKRILI